MKLAHVIVIDDPQPAGMIPLIRRINPTAKIIYRSRIHCLRLSWLLALLFTCRLLTEADIQIRSDLTDTPGTQQHEVWNFLWNSIQLVRRACFT